MIHNIHPTAHPKVFFAGGDILGENSFDLFDGLLICAGGFNGLTAITRNAVRRGTIPVPYRIHDGHYYALRNIPALIHRDLDAFSRQGCKRIGVHAHHDIPRAKAAIRAVVNWLDKHPGLIETVTFVDMRDDYFHCFGMEPLKTGAKLFNADPTGLEAYYEHRFLNELDGQFGIFRKGKDYPFCSVTKKPVALDMPDARFFSVALFYEVLVPQAIAKVTGDAQDMYAFLRRAGWPLMDRLMGGLMAPYVYLEDTGLLPKREQVQEWLTCAKAECPYFCRILTHYILNGIQTPRSADAIRLGGIGEETIKQIHREIRSQLEIFAGFLNGEPAPDNYYLPEKFRH